MAPVPLSVKVTAATHTALCRGDMQMGAELRLRAGKLGLTYEDRMNFVSSTRVNGLNLRV